MEQITSDRAQRYLVVGCGGSGKSTLARRISEVERLPYVNTDALYWSEDWKLRSDGEVLAMLPLDGESWVLDGNFVDSVDLVWGKADCVVWLNYPKAAIFWSLFWRNFLWCMGHSPAWNGRRMPLAVAWSGLRHFAGQYPRIQRTFPEFVQRLPKGKVLVLCSRKETAKWFASLAAGRE